MISLIKKFIRCIKRKYYKKRKYIQILLYGHINLVVKYTDDFTGFFLFDDILFYKNGKNQSATPVIDLTKYGINTFDDYIKKEGIQDIYNINIIRFNIVARLQ